MNEAIAAESKPKRKIKALAPPKLQAEVERKARVIRKHAEVLGPLGMEAIKVATLQLVASKLEELRRLLLANGVEGSPLLPVAGPLSSPVPPPPPRVLNPCVLCGRAGSYQMRFGSRGWYCAGEHANWARQEDGEELRSKVVSPSTTQPQPAPPRELQVPNTTNAQVTAPAPGLANALRMLQGDDQ